MKLITIPIAIAAFAAATFASPMQYRPRSSLGPAGWYRADDFSGIAGNSSSVSTRQNSPTHQLQRRDYSKVSGTVSCRDLTRDDLTNMNEDQLYRFLQYLNTRFPDNHPYDLANPQNSNSNIRLFGQMLKDDSFDNLSIHPFTDDEYRTWYPQSRATICLDATQAQSQGYQEDSGNCIRTELKTYGTLTDTGEVSIEVTQGYTLTATVSSETSSTIGGSLSVTVGADFEVASVEATVEVHYDTTTTNGQENTTEKSSEQTVTLSLNPPPGYSCFLEVSQQTCPGSMDVQIPFTLPSGAIMLHHGHAVHDAYSYDNGNHYFSFMSAYDLAVVFGDIGLNQHISASVGSTGSYKEYCQPQGDADDGGDNNTPTPSTTYVPQLTCPKNLKVVQGQCSYTAEDYLGQNMISGDVSNWAYNLAEYTQEPALGSVIGYGTSTVKFNVSTPYHWTECESLVQVVPPVGVAFSPLESVLTLPSDNSDLVTRYDVGYISECDLQQRGSCSVSNIQSLYTKDFKWTQTSFPGNPLESFTFSGTWPEYDRFTFTMTCSDPYGNQQVSQAYQEAYRGDIATATLTANTATQTFHSTTKYLYTSVKTFLTSVVIPQTTATLKTDTLYTATSYTKTASLTNYGAVKFSHTTKTTATETSTVKKTKTLHPTFTPGTTTLSIVETVRPTSTLTIERGKGVKTVLATLTAPHTKTVTVKAVPTKCPKFKADAEKEVIDARNIISTTTVLDKSDTATVVDYTDVATTILDATTTSTDLDDVYLTTSATINTLYDPIHTAITSGVKYDITTTILNSFTNTRTISLTSTTTTSTTRTKTATTTAKTATSTAVSTKSKTSTLTAYKNKPTSTSTLYVKTVQGANTVTHTYTKPAACTP